VDRRDAMAVARDLGGLLQGLEIPPPYVLVGHSLGGLHIRAFAKLYPEEVAGLVFIDPTTEGMHESLKTEEGRADVMRQLEGDTEGVKAEAAGMTEQRLQALQQRKFQLHFHLASQLPQGEQLVAERSHHYIHYDEPELVIGEIERLVARIRAAD
jgi:thioesterase domain-containing protein